MNAEDWLYPPAGVTETPGEGMTFAEALAEIIQTPKPYECAFPTIWGDVVATFEDGKVTIALGRSVVAALIRKHPQTEEAA